MSDYKFLKNIKTPQDFKGFDLPKLDELAGEVREKIVEVVSKNGGHLATNLGVVELTIALHYVFNCPVDKIIWDVGHQAYAHKLLTGRFEKFHTLRQFEGISGYPNRDESPYDLLTTGHSSASISQALAYAVARDFNKTNEKVIAVIGDGSMSGGLAFEAMNNAGQQKRDLIVILNDNEMAISKNVGALAEYLTRIITAPIYKKARTEIRDFVKKLPDNVSKRVLYTVEKIEESLKGLLVPGMFFEELGFFYIGPIDGHNIPQLVQTLESVKHIDGPVFIHVLTKKGKGYKHAEEEPSGFHGVGPFNKIDGTSCSKGNSKSFTNIFSEVMVELADKNEKLVGITAAMTQGVGLVDFADKYKDRFFDVGIAEGHAVTFSGALACTGYRPVVAIYSTFLQRAYDHILHDVCLQNAPVVFAIDRTGLVGEDGATHHGVFTVPYLRNIPNLVIGFPKDGKEMKEMFKIAFKQNNPMAICYPKTVIEDEVFGDYKTNKLEIGKAEILIEGKDLMIFVLGSLASEALKAVNNLRASGISVGLVNMRFVKPMDEDLIIKITRNVKNIITVEEGVLEAGFGSAFMEVLEKHGISDVKLKRIGLPTAFIEHGCREILLEKYGLDSKGIEQSCSKEMSLRAL